MNKKAFSLFENSAELVLLIALIFGLILSISLGSAILSYITISACGFMTGRMLYSRKHTTKFAYYVVVIAFVFGYLMGNLYGSGKVVIILFVLWNILSYKLHKEGYIRD